MSRFDLQKDFPYLEIFDNLNIGVALYDAEGNYLFVNTELVNWRNIPFLDFIQLNVHDFLETLDVCVFDLVKESGHSESRLQFYWDSGQVDSRKRLRVVTGTPLFDENGEMKYVVMILQDVERFENLYQTLLRQNKVVNYLGRKNGAAAKIGIIAKSESFRKLLQIAENVAALDSTVLLYGESGSGKEVLAHYLHAHSERSARPMITVNCAAISEALIESELFGYERGSFTGANREGKAGLVEAADGGTLFLDEINSLPLGVQGKVLRTIEEKTVQRVGSTKTKNVDFRLIAATNRNLADMVRAGSFREDLYYRLQVIPLTIPPIRERREDIVPLCLHFLHDFCTRYNIQKNLSHEVLETLENYEWPGNVREIRNFAERIVVMTPRSVKEINSIPAGLLEQMPKKRTEPGEIHVREQGQEPQWERQEKQETREEQEEREGKKEREDRERAEKAAKDPGRPDMQEPPEPGALSREMIIRALAECSGNRERTAALLGISRRQLQYKIKEFHLSSRCRYEPGEGAS